ncbi:MAG TPA: TolC family protein [Planctomycetota bacterium]|nr:TolC family protein [Planctomycetota bacterium]
MNTSTLCGGPAFSPAGNGSARLPALLLIALAACQAAPADPAAEAAIGKATGITDAVLFRQQGGPLDEPAAATERLTLAAAARSAITTDPSLQAALARVRIALADADQARLLPNPILDLALRFGQGKPKIDATLSAGIVQLLQRPRRTRAADQRLRQAAADAVTAALDVLAEVQGTYAAAQASDQLLPLLTNRLFLLGQLVELARLRARSGEGAAADVITLDAQRVELEVEVAAAHLEQRDNRLHLARLVGEPSAAAVWPLEPWQAPPAVADRDESGCIQSGLARRPEVQSAVWQLAALDDDPALSPLSPLLDASLGAAAQRDGDWTVGPALSSPLPLFDTGAAQRARVTAAQIEARHDLTAVRRKVVEEVRLAWQALADNLTNLARVQQQLVPLQQQRREVAEFSYRAGQTDVTALLLAEQDLRQAQVKAIETERQTTLAMVRLQRAVGGPGAFAAGAPESAAEPVRRND